MAISKNTVKFVKSLHLKKFRQKYDIFVVEGDKMAREMLAQSAVAIEQVYAVEAWASTHAGLLHGRSDLEIVIVTERELSQISSLTTPNQVLVVAHKPTWEWPSPSHFTRALYLDGIQDPGNMGTILRIADWFGIPFVFCSDTCVDVYNSKVIQASMGAFLRVQTMEIELAVLLERYAGLPVSGAFMEGTNAFDFSWPDKGLLVIGSEGEGISANNMPLINERVTIPKGNPEGAESLNAAIATGILCAIWSNKGL
jgi:TrmH family RNA methyltransferase